MKKVLIIEDDIELCISIKRQFETKGYLAIAVQNGYDGIKIAINDRPDVILCDIIMPAIDGYEVRKHLNKHQETAPIPFIYLSELSERNEIRYALNLGADDYIIKPFKISEMFKVVENRLKRINELKLKPTENTVNYNPLKKIGNIYWENEQILVYVKGEPEMIKLRDIVMITSEGNYSTIICSNGRIIKIRKFLKDWENILPDKYFFRARKTSIINLNYIIKMEKWYSRTILVKIKYINKNIIVSQRMAKVLKEKLGV